MDEDAMSEENMEEIESSEVSDFDDYEPDSEEGEQGGPASPPLPLEGEDEGVDIEQEDFTRLISAFQNEPVADTRDALPRSTAWKQSMEAEMESFHHELRDVNGFVRKGKVGAHH